MEPVASPKFHPGGARTVLCSRTEAEIAEMSTYRSINWKTERLSQLISNCKSAARTGKCVVSTTSLPLSIGDI